MDPYELTTPEPIIIKGQKLLAYIAAYEQFKKDQKTADVTKLTVILASSKDTTEVVFSYWPDPIKNSDETYSYPSPMNISEHGNAVSYVIENSTNRIIKKTYQR